MQGYTLTEVMRDLGISQHRLKKLLEDAAISPVQSSNEHGACKVITADEMERLRIHLHSTMATVTTDATLAGRVTALEQEMRQLRALLNGPQVIRAPRPHVTVTTERRPISAQAAQGKDWYTGDDSGHYSTETHLLTAGFIGILAEQHRPGAQETARKSWAPKMPAEARQTVAAAVLWMMANRGGMGRCDDVTCPCSDV